MLGSNESQPPFTVALDAMGGDFGPQETVPGALKATRDLGIEVLLVGDEAAVQAELTDDHAEGLPIEIVPSHGIIEETDHPLQAMREKPEASIVVATRLVKAGRAQAVVSMGSTGASMAVASLILGLIEGVERPAVGGPFLGRFSSTVFLDLGSNVDCRPSQLLGFAALGAAFARRIQGVQNPRVALLSVGVEEGKGNRQVREAYPLFQQSPLNFVGNVEGTDLFQGKADVVICDGFVGNILLKFAEGLGQELAQTLPKLFGSILPQEAMRKAGSEFSALSNTVEMAGGGPLFGVNGVSIVGHGRSRSVSVASAIEMAKHAWDVDVVGAMKEELGAIRQQVGM